MTSCIDLAFANSTLLAFVQDVNYLPSGLSDHAPLELILQVSQTCNASLWHLDAQWLLHPVISDEIPPLLED